MNIWWVRDGVSAFLALGFSSRAVFYVLNVPKFKSKVTFGLDMRPVLAFRLCVSCVGVVILSYGLASLVRRGLLYSLDGALASAG